LNHFCQKIKIKGLKISLDLFEKITSLRIISWKIFPKCFFKNHEKENTKIRQEILTKKTSDFFPLMMFSSASCPK